MLKFRAALFCALCLSHIPFYGESRDAQKEWSHELLNSYSVAFPIEVYAPLEFRDDKGQPAGLALDYLDLIIEKTGLSISRQSPKPWIDILEDAKNKKVDIVINIQKTEVRSEYLLFTEPFIEVPSVILIRNDEQGNISLKDLEGQKVGVTRGYSLEEYLLRSHISLDVHSYDSTETGITELSFGNIDAVVANLAVASWIIDNHGISNLKIGGYTDYSIDLRFAVRKDYPFLLEILNDGLNKISDREKDQLFRKWISIDLQPFYRNPLFIISILIAFVIIVISLIWNAILRKEIKRRIKAEEQNKELIGELEESLKKIKTLSGLVPICASCKKIRDDKGYWGQLEEYIEDHTNALFSHGICPECQEKIYGNSKWYKAKMKKRNNNEDTTDS